LRYIEGIASTEDWDQQDEQMLASGMDLDYLINKGTINWNHSHAAADLIGIPEKVQIKIWEGKPALWVRAALLPNVANADYAWTLMNAYDSVKSMGGPIRTVGWSVEGGVLRKENGRITKSVIRNLALTQEPVNDKTFGDFAKSLNHNAIAKTFSSGGSVNPTFAGADDAGAALRLENLSAGRRDEEDEDEERKNGTYNASLVGIGELRRSLAASGSPHYDARTGRFVNGFDGMFKHLTQIDLMPFGAAAELVSWLRAQSLPAA